MERCLGCMNEFDSSLDLCPHCGYAKGTAAKSKNHLTPGTVLIDRYLIGRCLGQGGFGITYIAWDQHLYKKVAIKEFMPTSLASRITGRMDITCYNDEAQELFRYGAHKMLDESRRLARFNSLESVVDVLDWFEANLTAYIVMELLEGDTLKAILAQRNTMDLTETKQIMLPVLQALREIHTSGLIHRDISPDNIFVCKNGKVKLLDFGSARVATGSDEKSMSVILKQGYAPKEQYSSSAAQGPYTDVYAVCATIYKMLTGITPIDSLARQIKEDELAPIGTLVAVPDAFAAVITQGLALEPNERLQTVEPLLEAFEALQTDAPGADASDLPPDDPAADDKEPTTDDPAKKSRKKRRLIIAAVCAAVLLLGAAGFFARPHIRDVLHPVPDVTSVDTVEPEVNTPYQQQLLEQAFLSQAPTERLPQPADRETIIETYADALTYQPDAGELYAEYTDENGSVLLRDHVLLPLFESEDYELTTYLEDGKKGAVARYMNDGSLASAELYYYNMDGSLYALTTYEGSDLLTVEEFTQYDTDGRPAEAVLHYGDGTEETTAYDYDSTAEFRTRKNEDGKTVYEYTRYLDDNSTREVWHTGKKTTTMVECTVDASGRPLSRKVTETGRQQARYVWLYDEDTDRLTEHTAFDKNDKQQSAIKFVYDKDGPRFIIREKDSGIKTCQADLDGGFYLYEYDRQGNMIMRAQYAAQDELVGRMKTEYDDEGNFTRVEYYDENDELTRYYADYSFWEKGHSYTAYDAQDTKEAVYSFGDDYNNIMIYDQKGRMISESHYESNVCTYTADYKYDGKYLVKQTIVEYDEEGVNQKSRTVTTFFKTDPDSKQIESETFYGANNNRRRVLTYDEPDRQKALTFYDEDGNFYREYSRETTALGREYIRVTFADGSTRRMRTDSMQWYAEEPFDVPQESILIP